MRNLVLVSVILQIFSIMFAIEGIADSLPPWAERTKAIGKLQKMPEGYLDKRELDKLVEIGEDLFAAKFTRHDGAGRPMATSAILPTKSRRRQQSSFFRTSGPDAGSCGSCHNEPLLGGAGDFVSNVFVSEGFTHTDFDTIDPQFSNERGTNHLFGAGLIELLAREMSFDLANIRQDALKSARLNMKTVRQELITKGVSFGYIKAFPDGLVDLNEVDGIDSDLVIRPFSQKGVMTSLRQFTINASNHHHGMQASERFGPRWTGSSDFDEDGKKSELSSADISALVAWQATLPPPVITIPDNQQWLRARINGQKTFNNINCVECHISALPLNSLRFEDPGPWDTAGTLKTSDVKISAIYDLAMRDWAQSLLRNQKGQILVPLFGDLKRHKMTDHEVDAFGNELLSQRFVDRNIFMTSELWGVASTAPFGHRNNMSDLDEVIVAHGGQARASRDAYLALGEKQKGELIAFLRTLEIK